MKPEYRLPGQTGIKGIVFFIAGWCGGKAECRVRITRSALAWLGLAWLGLAWLGLAWLGSIVIFGLIKKKWFSQKNNRCHKKKRILMIYKLISDRQQQAIKK
ncbi:hypothetical protein NIO92_004198 [Salmonella enterica]|nr:hypothetical protein [Salmonella enterica]EJN0204874.1 hypothetical protein [Salmonella enterica]